MVFERFRTTLLKKQLALAKGVSKTQQKLAKAKLKRIKKNQDVRDELLSERLKIRKEQQSLRDQIKKAREKKLTKTEKQTLERQLAEKKVRDEKIGRLQRMVSDNIFKGLRIASRFIQQLDENVSDRPRKRKKTKRTPTKKKRSSIRRPKKRTKVSKR